MSTDPADPRLSDDEVDARFAGLVADWEPPSVADTAGTDGGEDRIIDDIERGSPLQANPGINPPISISIPVWRGASGPTIDEIIEAEENEEFVPGPVTLPPGEDLHYWGAVVGLIGGPLLLLWIYFANPFHRVWWITGGLALMIGGFVLLVLRGPAHRDLEDDDSGARV